MIDIVTSYDTRIGKFKHIPERTQCDSAVLFKPENLKEILAAKRFETLK